MFKHVRERSVRYATCRLSTQLSAVRKLLCPILPAGKESYIIWDLKSLIFSVEGCFTLFSQLLRGSHRISNFRIWIPCWELFGSSPTVSRIPHHADMSLAEKHLNMTRRWWRIESSYTDMKPFPRQLVTVKQLDGDTQGFQTICWQGKKYNIQTIFLDLSCIL